MRQPLLSLDLCALKRPWDDQRVARNRQDAEVVGEILKSTELGTLKLVDSAALRAENAHNPDPERRKRTECVLDACALHLRVAHGDGQRQVDLANLGFGPFDALHIAIAERLQVDALVTTDDEFVRHCRKNAKSLRVEVLYPLDWIRRSNRSPGFVEMLIRSKVRQGSRPTNAG